jgi:hypothetical protein
MSTQSSVNILTPGHTTLTSKGDILSHNGTTSIRIPVGSSGFAINANSASVGGVYWTTAPVSPTVGFEAISYTTNTAAVSSVEFSGISGGYRILHFVMVSLNTTTASANNEMYIRINGSSASVYKEFATRMIGTNSTSTQGTATTRIGGVLGIGYGSYSNGRGLVHGWINQYANTSAGKTGYILGVGSRADSVAGGGLAVTETMFEFASNNAITSITFFAGTTAAATTFAANCKFYIYGVK